MRRIRFRTIPVLLFIPLAGVWILGAYSASFPLYFIRRCGWDILVFLWIAVSSFGPGRILVSKIAGWGIPRAKPAPKTLQSPIAVSNFPAFEEALLSFAVGLGVLAYLALIVNLLNLLHLSVVVPVMVILGVLGIAQLWSWKCRELLPKPALRKTGRPRKMPPLFRWTLRICIVVPIVLSFFMALGPVSQSDAIRYHMAVPALYVYHGGDVLIPDSAFSNFPFTIEMLYTLGLLLGSESSSQLIHWFYFVLLCGMVYALARHVHSRNYGISAVVMLTTTPFIPIFASWAFIEIGLTLYLFLTFYCLIRLLRCLRGSEKPGEDARPPDPAKRDRFLMSPVGWIISAGIFCGLSMGIKYTAGASFLIAVGVLILKALKDRRGPIPKSPIPNPIRNILLFCVISAFVASPWYLKNLVRFRNPLYPFLSSVFPTPGWDEYNATFYKFQSGQKGELNEFRRMDATKKIWDIATLPYSLTTGRKLITFESPVRGDIPYLLTCRWERLLPFRTEDGIRGGLLPFLAGGNVDRLAPYKIGFGGWEVGPLWLLLVPLYFTIRRTPFETRFAVVIAAIHYFIWAITYRDNRFLAPTFALLSLPAGYFLAAIQQKRRGIHLVLRICFMLILLRNLGWIVQSSLLNYSPIPYITGTGVDLLKNDGDSKSSLYTGDTIKEDYLGYTRDTASFIHPMSALNRIRKDGEKVLLVGEYRPYHCKAPYIGCDWFNTPPLLRMIHETPDARKLADILYNEGVRYVFINQGELDKYWFANYVGFFYPANIRIGWLNGFLQKPVSLPPLETQKAWQVYNDFLHSDLYLEEIPETDGGPISRPFTEEEITARREKIPPLPPANAKVGVYKLKKPS